MASRKPNEEIWPVAAGQVGDKNADADKKVTADAGVTPATQATEPKADQSQQDAAQGAQAAATATETQKVSNNTIQAEKEAKRSLSAAKKTIEDASDVEVLPGSVSEVNVDGEVQARKDEANANGEEADARWTAETLRNGGEYGAILRAKGIVAAADGGQWLHYDFVPEEHQIRRGPADYTGRLCVIGSGLKEDKLRQLFGL